VQLPESRDLNILSRNTLQALMSAAIALLAVVNIAYLFRYVLEQRRRTFGVSMLCGCSRKRASRLLLGETVLYLFLCFGVCVPVFHWGLSPWFLELSGYRFSLDAVDYGILFVVYTAASLLVLYSVIRKYSRTSIRQQLQGG
ncbi:MAG: hypothetical protein LIO46_05420, partial [Clostridiales bacterium]|nr:hypothetical protein [Clostridiales bacterium]